MSVVRRFFRWLDKATSPPPVPQPDPTSILTSTLVRRTYTLTGTGAVHVDSSAQSGLWDNIPRDLLVRFVEVFNRREDWGSQYPHIQFDAQGEPGAVHVAGIAGYDSIGTFNVAWVEIHPTRTSHAVLHYDGGITFANIEIRFTAGIYNDVPLAVRLATITRMGELVVTEA
jgi:hypothetical protein